MLIVLVSAKGSPGVSTAALALAATWPQGAGAEGWRIALLEADPSGGDVAAAFGLDAEPGLLTLAASARRDHRAELLWEHTQTLPGGLAVIAAPTAPEQAATATDALLTSSLLQSHRGPTERTHADQERSWHPASFGPSSGPERNPLEDHATRPAAPFDRGAQGHARRGEAAHTPVVDAQSGGGVLIIDAGRLPPRIASTPAGRLLEVADVVLLVTANSRAGLSHAATRLASLRAHHRPAPTERATAFLDVRLLLVGTEFAPADVARTLDVAVVGTLPHDERAARALAGYPLRGVRTLARLPLLRAAAMISARLCPPAPAAGHPDSAATHTQVANADHDGHSDADRDADHDADSNTENGRSGRSGQLAEDRWLAERFDGTGPDGRPHLVPVWDRSGPRRRPEAR